MRLAKAGAIVRCLKNSTSALPGGPPDLTAVKNLVRSCSITRRPWRVEADARQSRE
jgi:hypothetical protein